PVEGWAVQRRKGLEFVERAVFREHLGIEFEGRRRGENAGAAAGRLFCRDRMRRAVGAEKERGVSRSCGAAQGAAMCLALGDRQAIEMRPDAALKDRIAVDDQMMRGDRRRHIGSAILDIGDRVFRRHMLKSVAQFRMPTAQGDGTASDYPRYSEES